MANTEGFFAKYGIELTDWNGIKKIVDTAKLAQKHYEKNEDKGLKKLAHLKCMIEDWFEAKGEDIEEYYKKD